MFRCFPFFCCYLTSEPLNVEPLNPGIDTKVRRTKVEIWCLEFYFLGFEGSYLGPKKSRILMIFSSDLMAPFISAADPRTLALRNSLTTS